MFKDSGSKGIDVHNVLREHIIIVPNVLLKISKSVTGFAKLAIRSICNRLKKTIQGASKQEVGKLGRVKWEKGEMCVVITIYLSIKIKKTLWIHILYYKRKTPKFSD